jgi:hypothetical protein
MAPGSMGFLGYRVIEIDHARSASFDRKSLVEYFTAALPIVLHALPVL